MRIPKITILVSHKTTEYTIKVEIAMVMMLMSKLMMLMMIKMMMMVVMMMMPIIMIHFSRS